MKPVFPSPVPTWHNDTYSAISPDRSELQVKDKTVVITGAGSGIGRETALTFATAGASHVHLLGRNTGKLQETVTQLPSTAGATVHAVDITDAAAVQSAAKAVGKWDVLILSAGYLAKLSTVQDAQLSEWWQSFETNIRGTFNMIQSFLPTAGASASILGVVTAGIAATVDRLGGMSSYMTSKGAEARLLEFAAHENPGLFVATLQPGIVDTDMFRKADGKTAMDTVQLPAHFMLWLVSEEARFLRGKTVWANWDVEELKKIAKEIQGSSKMTCGVIGWPYEHT